MFGGRPCFFGRDPHLDSRVDLDKSRPSIARHGSLSIGIGLEAFDSPPGGYRVCVGRSPTGRWVLVTLADMLL